MDEHQIREHRIRELAYQLWEANGKPDGSANRFWDEAAAHHREEEAGGNVIPLKVRERR